MRGGQFEADAPEDGDGLPAVDADRDAVTTTLNLPTVPRGSDQPISLAEAWLIAIDQLRLKATRNVYDTWLRDITVLGYERAGAAHMFTRRAADACRRDWLATWLQGTIERTLGLIVGDQAVVQFEVWK